MSSDAAGIDVNLDATVGRDTGRSGLADGDLLIGFTEAVVRRGEDVAALRQELVDRIGPDAAGHTVATISAFSGLVRVADGTGIPIDDGLAAVSAETRSSLALDSLGGAANSKLDEVTASEFDSVNALFDNSR